MLERPGRVPPDRSRGRCRARRPGRSCGSRACASPIPSAPCPALDGVDLVVPAGRTLLLTGTSGAGQDDAALGAAAVRRRRRRADHGERDGPARTCRSRSGAAGSRGCRSGRTCSTPAWPTTSGSGCPTPTTRPSRGPSRSPRPRTSSPRCPTGTPPGSASAAPGCRRASASGSRWRGPSCAGSTAPRWCCSTSPPRTSTRTTRRPSAAGSPGCWTARRGSSSPTTRAGRTSRTRPSGWRRAASVPPAVTERAAAAGATRARYAAVGRATCERSAVARDGSRRARRATSWRAATRCCGCSPSGRPRAGRFALGVLAGAAATASGVGLLSVSAWLIAMAATQPPLTLLSIAIVATRALGVLRGVTRYLERLVTHDAALRTLADARARVYARLAHTEPVRRFRSGDLVTRLVSDTDATQDLLVRGLAPPAAALVTGAGVVALSTALLAPGGALLAAGLLLAGVGVPVAAALAGRGPGPPGDGGPRRALDRADRHRARRPRPPGLRRDGPGRRPGHRRRRRAHPGRPARRRAARARRRRLRADRGADAVGHAAARRRRRARRRARRRPAGRAGADRAGGVRDRRPAAGGRRPARRRAGGGRPAVRRAGRAARRPGPRATVPPGWSERGVG